MTTKNIAEVKTAFVEAIRTRFFVKDACRLTGATRAEWRDWCEEDEAFVSAFMDAQDDFVDGMHALLIRQAKGTRSKRQGNYLALISFLNAHDEAYGRIRMEVLERMLLPVIERMANKFAKHVAPETVEQVRAECLSEAYSAILSGNGKKVGKG